MSIAILCVLSVAAVAAAAVAIDRGLRRAFWWAGDDAGRHVAADAAGRRPETLGDRLDVVA